MMHENKKVKRLEDTEFVRTLEKTFYEAKSRGYQWNEFGEIEEFAHVNLDHIDVEDREAFERIAMENHGFGVDFEHGALLNGLGPDEITINEDGDVFEGSKLIIRRSEYSDEQERNAQIEAHMETTGCYPGVFLTDRYGNVVLVNTKGGDK